MQPIKLCLLWHQHQPYYRAGNEFLMPWAWLHATKDYLEMAEHLERHPAMRATINLVPSLVKQIEEYITPPPFQGGGASPTMRGVVDRVLDLMTKDAETLWRGDQTFMLDNFFLGHRATLIDRSNRFRELCEMASSHDREARFNVQDYRDLAVHYSLAWTGEIARMREPFKSLIEKDRGYSEEDKQALAHAQFENVRRIIPLHKELARRGQIELTTTPFYHPILPLLVDLQSAREAMPNVELPRAPFHAPDEADRQIRRARAFFEAKLGITPQGMWPSEGSLSQEVLALIRKNGFTWTASDEAVLAHTIAGSSAMIDGIALKPEHAKYFPWRATTHDGEIVVFFRDHGLSDDIGFTYQSWNSNDAVEHFVANILRIRSELIAAYGEDVMNEACISVILDGENCWEYYPRNGFEFLDKLYSALASTPEIHPATFSEVVASTKGEELPLLPRLVAGSWIDANFKIWIGHPEDNAAWDVLSAALDALVRERAHANTLQGTEREAALARVEAAHEELMIAEGSDWNWWYGDEHFSAQKDLFDELYRMHLREVYRALDLKIPEVLSVPIAGRFSQHAPAAKYGAMHPAAAVA
ncbi:MAG TPA: glycoside hydrolase family 57 protein [Candidatus Kapabacteria bacterium]|nr:glycoside hydrolase family 57 protein [Candidatus Kapabacteria bacterium]